MTSPELRSHKSSHWKGKAWGHDWCGLGCTYKSDVKCHKNLHCPNRKEHGVESCSEDSELSCTESVANVANGVKKDKRVATGHTKIKTEKKPLLKFTYFLSLAF